MSPSYAFYASASALGGVIRQGNRTTVIPTIGSVCLASSGGQASNSVDDYDRDGISFTKAETRVGGYSASSPDGRVYTTVSEVLLLNLRIFERLSIARMQAIVTSKRTITSDDPMIELQPDRTVFSVMINYQGVEIDGDEVGPVVDQQLCDASSYTNFTSLLAQRPERLLQSMQDALDYRAGLPEPKPMPPMSGGLVTFPGNARAHANRISLDTFGKASFGDLVVKPDRQRVNLVRLSLDTLWIPERPVKGTMDAQAVAEAQADGDPPPGGEGGSASAGDGGTNGVPLWP